MEKDNVKPHSYDGIQEYDNQLPRWWVGTFVITVVFGLMYWLYYQTYHKGPSQTEEYRQTVKENDEKAAKNQAGGGGGPITAAEVALLQSRSDMMAETKAVFTKNCVVCHGDKAQGVIGPNLTDEYWIHGGKPEQIQHTIKTGVLDKGMLSWQGILSEDQIKHLVAYILSLQGSNPPNAKPPQGEKLTP